MNQIKKVWVHPRTGREFKTRPTGRFLSDGLPIKYLIEKESEEPNKKALPIEKPSLTVIVKEEDPQKKQEVFKETKKSKVIRKKKDQDTERS